MAILWMVNSSEVPLMMKRLNERKSIPQDWAEQDFLRGQRPGMEHGLRLIAIAGAIGGMMLIGYAIAVAFVQWCK
jgi:hypothetical protein